MAERGSLEFTDYNGEIIVLTDSYYNHIIERHGSEMTQFSKNWEETLKSPDFTGESKTKAGCKIYIQQNNKNRNFPAKYLVIVVNEINFITSVRFGSNLNFIKNLKKSEL